MSTVDKVSGFSLKNIFECKDMRLAFKDIFILHDISELIEVIDGNLDLFIYDKTIGTALSERLYVCSVKTGDWVFPMHLSSIFASLEVSQIKKTNLSIMLIPRDNTTIRITNYTHALNTIGQSSPLNQESFLDKFHKWITLLDDALSIEMNIVQPYRVQKCYQQELFQVTIDKLFSSENEIYIGITPARSLNLFTRSDVDSISPEMLSEKKAHSQVSPYRSENDPNSQNNNLYFISSNTYYLPNENCSIELYSLLKALQHFSIHDILNVFYKNAIILMHEKWNGKYKSQSKRLKDFNKIIKKTHDRIYNSFLSVVNGSKEKLVYENESNQLLKACKYIGEKQGIAFKKPIPNPHVGSNSIHYVNQIADSSNVRIRSLELDSGWWVKNAGYILGFYKNSNNVKPVIFKPKMFQGYEIIDLEDNSIKDLNHANFEIFSPTAFMFYTPLPSIPLTGKDIAKYAFREMLTGIWIILLCIALLGIMNWVSPLIQQRIFNNIIPEGIIEQLLPVICFMISVGFAQVFISGAQSLAILSVKGHADATLGAAIYDRLLSLPSKFFRKYSSGELLERTNSFNQLRDIITGTTISTLLNSVSSLFSFAVLFKFNVKLSVLAILTSIVTAGLMVVQSIVMIKYQTIIQKLNREATGLLYQLIGGITKLQIAGAESRGFQQWSKKFIEQNTIQTKAAKIGIAFKTSSNGWQLLVNLFIYIYIVRAIQSNSSMSTGEFIAFTSAFGSASAALNNLSGLIITYVQSIPILQQAKPLLEAVPEIRVDATDPGFISGKISIQDVKFRYAENAPLVLHGVSLNIQPGEFVAVCGSSGAGKSSLIRLLLGLDEPEEGGVYYDDKDLSKLDIRAVRRQIGVVVQNATINPGDIFTNIVGSLPYTVDEAWEAVRMAGIEEDIKKMPMGLHTYISEGGGSLSGGQIQRLIIARALIRKPKVIIFDEATSALDNKTQAIVSRSVEQLNATRIVIAHRLSTIEHADKILVMDKGLIVQQGTYQELVKQPGLFQELAKRQIA